MQVQSKGEEFFISLESSTGVSQASFKQLRIGQDWQTSLSSGETHMTGRKCKRPRRRDINQRKGSIKKLSRMKMDANGETSRISRRQAIF